MILNISSLGDNLYICYGILCATHDGNSCVYHMGIKEKCLLVSFNPFPPRTVFGPLLSLAIHISPNNSAINMIQNGKLVVNVLVMHCAH